MMEKIFIYFYFLYKNIFEYEEIRFALNYANNNQITIMDIGANIGWFSTTIAQNNRKSILVACEPINSNFILLDKRIHLKKLKNVYPYELALSDRIQKNYMRLDPTSHANAKISLVKTDVLVDTVTIDSFIKTYTVGLIKIDTQGHEFAVLNGSVKTILAFAPALLIEIDNSDKIMSLKIYNFLIAYNYDIYLKFPTNQVMIQSELLNIPGYFSIYCISNLPLSNHKK